MPLATLRRNAGTLTPDNRETPRRLSVSLLPRLGVGNGPDPFVTLAMVDVPTVRPLTDLVLNGEGVPLWFGRVAVSTRIGPRVTAWIPARPGADLAPAM